MSAILIPDLSLPPAMEAKAAHVLSLLDEESKRLRVPALSHYREMIGSKRKQVAELVSQVKAGKLSFSGFDKAFEGKIQAAHVSALVMGRQRAGDLRDKQKVDMLMGLMRAGEDRQYLDGFTADLQNGRYGYGDDLDERAVLRRANMYLNKARGTANEAFVLASPATSLFDWVMLALEDHCGDCPALAEGGPYTRTGLPTYPGRGKTACWTECHCVVVRNDNVVGFYRYSEAA